MADTIFTTQVPNQTAFDAAWHTLGQRTEVSAAADLIGGRAWFPLVPPANFFWVVWRISDQVIVAQVDLAATFPIPTLGAWNVFTSADFDTPGDVALDPAEQYACAVATNGDFVYRDGDPTFPIGPGIVTALEALFHNGGAGPVFPATGASDVYFFADMTVEAAAAGVDATMAFTLPLPLQSTTLQSEAAAQLAVVLPQLQFAATAQSATTAAVAFTLPKLQMSILASSPIPPAPGTGSLTVTVDDWAQLEAVAQRVLCWATRPEMVQMQHRLAGLERLYLPEAAFGAGPLVMNTGGPNLLAAFTPGEHRLVSLGNGAATEVIPQCQIAGIPGVQAFTTRIGGNPFTAELAYANIPGNGPVNLLWGDGTMDPGQPESATLTHLYPGEGTYTITIQDQNMLTDVAVFAVHIP